MHLEPLLRAPLAVQIHVLTVVPAFFLGTWLLFLSRRGSRIHRVVGTAYLTLMAFTSMAAIFIRAFGPMAVPVGPFRFGLFHLFVPLTLNGIAGTIMALRAGNLRGHQRSMLGVYFGGLLIAGLLAFLPGRIMHRIFFG